MQLLCAKEKAFFPNVTPLLFDFALSLSYSCSISPKVQLKKNSPLQCGALYLICGAKQLK